jgi:hemerythrin
LIDELQSSIADGQATGARVDKQAVAKIRAELLTYTKAHFEAEEEFLESKGMSRPGAHKPEHQRLTSHVRFQDDFAADGRRSIRSF